jgi:hypothetical protein
MARAFILVAMVGALFLAQPAISPTQVAAGVACDLKIRHNHGPLVDGGVEFYRRHSLLLVGEGFPASTTLSLTVHANGALVHSEELPSGSSGGVARDVTFIGFLVDDADAPADLRITVHDPSDPTGCTDVVDLVRLPDPPFDDLLPSIFLDEIVWLHDAGLAAGCTPDLFCPFNRITRGEVAVFLVRALALPPTTDDFFVDDDGHKYEWAINRLAAAGHATGCAADAFCPNDRITRGEIASFLVAGFGLAASDVDAFTDDDGLTHEADINALAAAGVTTGCRRAQPERYCPHGTLTRGELAGFLFRALQ